MATKGMTDLEKAVMAAGVAKELLPQVLGGIAAIITAAKKGKRARAATKRAATSTASPPAPNPRAVVKA